jgi:hypothetical protein
MLALLLLSAVSAPPENPLQAAENWGQESIQLPPGFAAKLTLKGWEHIRFAPEMFTPKSDRFFSYALVFEVDKVKVDKERLEKEMLTYYRGLADSVSGGKIETKDFKIEWLEFDKDDAKKLRDGTTAFRCKLHWVEPFKTNKKQTLLVETHAWSIAEKTHLFFCVSSADWKHDVWKDLSKIRDQYEAAN